MAYTKTPMDSSEQTQTVDLLYDWDSRNSSQDGYDTMLFNALAEPAGQKSFHMLKRYGLEKLTLQFQSGIANIVGIYHWYIDGNNDYLIVVYQTTSQTIKVSAYTTDALLEQFSFGAGAATGTLGNIPTYFQEYLYQNGTVDLLIAIGGTNWRLQWGPPGLTQILGAGEGALAYLDGYAVQSNGTALLNSNLNDPTTWSASNFINVDSYADRVQRISRVGPYIVAFGSDSIQYYYDAANPSGTPFGAVTGATQRIGFLGGYANVGDDIYFIGQANQQAPSLYKVSGLRVEPVQSFPFSRMWLSQQAFGSTTLARDGSVLSLNGHTCYYVSTSSTNFTNGLVPPANLNTTTYIYDLDAKMWSKIGFQGTNTLNIKTAATLSPAASGGVPGPVTDTMSYINMLGSAFLYRFRKDIYQDDGVNFNVTFRTKPYDFDSRRMKFGGRLLVTGDQTAASSMVNISWSDNDYKTTSTPRQVDMVYDYQPLYALGCFRARAFTVSYADNFPMRWQKLELDYSIGTA